MVNSEHNIVCNHSDEFYYTSPDSNCAAYYRCHKAQVIISECPFMTMFDFYDQKCVSSSSKSPYFTHSSSSSKSPYFTHSFFIDKSLIIQIFAMSQHVKESSTEYTQILRKHVADFISVSVEEPSFMSIVARGFFLTGNTVILLIE